MGWYERADYWPSHGALVLRELGLGEDREFALSEAEAPSPLGGSVAAAGYGWLHAPAWGDPQPVVLERCDGPPPVEDCAHAVETSYLSYSGRVGLNHVVGVHTIEGLDLGGPGDYRVRVQRLPGPRWRLRFWPAPAEAPRWLAREQATEERLAADVRSLAAWSEHTGQRWTLATLADRLLLAPDRVPALLAGVVVDGDPRGEFGLALPDPEQPDPEWLAPAPIPVLGPQTDAATGVRLTVAEPDVRLEYPDGTVRELWLPSNVRLAPGALGLYTTCAEPPSVTWYDLTEADPVGRVVRLPESAQVSDLAWTSSTTAVVPTADGPCQQDFSAR
ncbi:hypothetical protein JOF53_000264 [Crossiella equi]|uniref:Uncharacterized protein n=1 Tax=Crossiella equi TaxID=130796 RepID=A0ABS5A569_9PSEU|nr:hypothetical protein [Crossiella equi]MBP2471392.1 hypothetical protein [Crossiella equi]